MNIAMRLLAPLTLAGLLAACAGEPAVPPQPQPTTKPAPEASSAAAPAPLPAHLRELSGSLLGVPSDSEVELALLLIDARGLPQGLLGNVQLTGNGAALPFRLPFNPQAFIPGTRVELRGRVNQAGRLILRLPPRAIHYNDSQQLGELRLVPAP
ncbi:MAG: hypothetical protein A3J25_19005 [Pseudomonadales bacterium RIFCSPLOWO2_02_FULL_63_210]|nr:MAG: hypothetical protein A3J25_19005 [Pseudomonadales bacterium RIFCSPLOWO2_02_FULL_63_210]